jgi:hypothetical protein
MLSTLKTFDRHAATRAYNELSATPPMDPDEWDSILFEEGEKEKRQNEWKMKRSKPRTDRPQVTNMLPDESSASGSGGDDIETDKNDDSNNDNDGTEEGDPLNEAEEVEEMVMLGPESFGGVF